MSGTQGIYPQESPPAAGQALVYSTPGGAAGFSSDVIVAAPALLYAIGSDSEQAADRWIHFFDAVAVPAAGAAPYWTCHLPPNGAQMGKTFAFTVPLHFGTGLSVAISSAQLVLDTTGIVAANHNMFLQYSD